MRKALLIMAAALMTMTQCRKQETMPVTPSANTIKMTITAGSGAKTDINTETGAITWSAGDKLYVSKNGSWLGCLELVNGENTANGTFAGDVTGIGDGDTPCHFFYLGKGNIATTPTGTAAVSISLASQDGTLAGAMKYHAGYGRTDVTVTEGEATGYVEMNTKIAIAHINFTTGGTTAYTGSVTMGGTGISNTLTVSPAGSFSGSGDGGIAIDKGDGTTGERFVTLIPTGETSIFVAFTGDATGSMAFANGIVENKFYGMKDAIAVTLEAAAPKFSVSATTTVEFAPGNLYWDGSAFHFETNQWGTQPTSDGEWVSSHVSHFYWSATESVAYAASYSESGTTTSDVFFTNSTETTANPDFHVNGETGTNTWRTLSRAEWNYLLGFDPEQWTQTETYGRPGAKAKSAWKDLGGGVKGLVILPDDTEDPETVMSSISSTADLETYGAVFLPAAGYRYGTDVYDAGSNGNYWSGTPIEVSEDDAYYMYFSSGDVSVYDVNRDYGFSVRLVR